MGKFQEQPIQLSPTERSFLEQQTKNGQWSAREILRAKILLLADLNNPEGGKVDQEISDLLGCALSTVYLRRKRFATTQSIEDTIFDKARTGRPTIVDGAIEAHLTKIACSTAPKGHTRWSLNLIRDKVVSLQVIDKISSSTIRRALKKSHKTMAKKGVENPA